MRTLKAALLGGALLLAAGQARAEGDLFLYNWSNYIPPELLARFEKESGIKVTLDVYDSNETMVAKLQAGAGGYDVVLPSTYMIKPMVAQGLLEEIDAASLPNFKNVKETFRKQPFDPDNAYTAPYLWGTTGYSYDSARVPGGSLPESWAPFFEPPPELDKQVAAMNDEVEVWNAAAYYLGIDKCTADKAEAQKILDLLEAQKPHLAMYQSDGTIDRMAAKEVIMHQQWNGAAHRTKEKLPSVVYVYPKEGLTLWGDNFAVPKGAPHLENAKTFINWMMDPKNIAEASNFAGYNNAIEGSEDFLDPAFKDDPAMSLPEGYEDRLRPTEDCSNESRELRNRVWTRLKS
ncbi:MAG: extracellular solute-binding protein [Geminicoccaceae bacterium]|nr:extracellular solute-binding protein [Geminicoccaceae bacterium]